MIILIGTKTHLIQEGQIKDVDCPKCSGNNSLTYRIYSKYVHLTMIPLFPVGKIFESECSDCNVDLDYEDFSENDKQKIINQKEIKNTETPFWTYSGSALAIGFLIYGINYYIENNHQIEERIKTPTSGDVYNLKLDSGYYSTIRIDKISNDSIYTTQNDYQTNLPFDVDEIDIPENYTESKAIYSKKEILDLYEKDIISSIKRNK